MLRYQIRIVIFQLNFSLGRLVQCVGWKCNSCRHGDRGYIVDVEVTALMMYSSVQKEKKERINETMNRRRRNEGKKREEWEDWDGARVESANHNTRKDEQLLDTFPLLLGVTLVVIINFNSKSSLISFHPLIKTQTITSSHVPIFRLDRIKWKGCQRMRKKRQQMSHLHSSRHRRQLVVSRNLPQMLASRYHVLNLSPQLHPLHLPCLQWRPSSKLRRKKGKRCSRFQWSTFKNLFSFSNQRRGNWKLNYSFFFVLQSPRFQLFGGTIE